MAPPMSLSAQFPSTAMLPSAPQTAASSLTLHQLPQNLPQEAADRWLLLMDASQPTPTSAPGLSLTGGIRIDAGGKRTSWMGPGL